MYDFVFIDAMANFRVKTRRRAHDHNIGIGIEDIEDSTCGDLSTLLVFRRDNKYMHTDTDGRIRTIKKEYTDLAAANHQNSLMLDLPGQNQAPSTLHLGEILLGVGHVG
jgi:hypothetical protein